MREYKILFKKYRKSIFDYYENSFFTSIYRVCAILIFPLLKNFSPNHISILSLLLGFTALMTFHFFEEIGLNIIVLFFLASYVLDFTDGIVARYQNKTSFNGRFMDGLFDIIVGSILHIIFFKSIFELNNSLILYFYLITIVLHPIQHLVMDRYSALARWINEVNKNKKLKPYYRNDFLGKYTKLIYDIQHICIWCILFNFFNHAVIINLFFLFSFLASILSISIYLFLSKKHFSLTRNHKDNREK